MGAGWPDLHTPPRTGARAAGDAAVVVGEERYTGLPSVPFAVRDADAAALWLLHTRGVPPERVHRVVDARRDAVWSALTAAAREVGPDGVLWVFWSGHGALDPLDGTPVLLTREARSDMESVMEAGVTLPALQQLAEASPARAALLMLDTGFGGVDREGAPLFDDAWTWATDPGDASSARVVTWIGTAPWRAPGVHRFAQQGLFTWFTLGGLHGWADGALGVRDGAVSLGELGAWIPAAQRRHGVSDLAPRTPVPPALVDLALAAPHASGGLRLPPNLTGATPLDAPTEAATALSEDDAARARAELDGFARDAETLRLQVQERADRDWAQALRAVSAGGEEAEAALQRFLTRYSAVSFTLPRGEVVVTASQAREAQALLAGGGRFRFPSIATEPLAPGTYRLSDDPRGDDDVDATPRAVRLERGLRVGVTEVTQARYTAVMGANPSVLRGDDLPVTHVGWVDAALFCNRLSERDGLAPAYRITASSVSWDREANGWRLPTEAEWEAAATGALDGAEAPCDRANLADRRAELGDEQACDDGHGGLAPVGGREPWRGLYDPVGNVWEWTWDAWTTGGPRGAPRPSDDGAPVRVIKGGSFLTPPEDAAPALRAAADRRTRRGDVGFRVVRWDDAQGVILRPHEAEDLDAGDAGDADDAPDTGP
jgi:formylglycine-generating enzyme required for sulfatase activity